MGLWSDGLIRLMLRRVEARDFGWWIDGVELVTSVLIAVNTGTGPIAHFLGAQGVNPTYQHATSILCHET